MIGLVYRGCMIGLVYRGCVICFVWIDKMILEDEVVESSCYCEDELYVWKRKRGKEESKEATIICYSYHDSSRRFSKK